MTNMRCAASKTGKASQICRQAWIFSHGDLAALPDRTEDNQDILIIAADAGARHLLSAGCLPHIAVGDFDSLSPGELALLEQSGCDVRKHPCAKNETDTHLATDIAIAAGAKEITVFGGIGGRLDHSLANVQLLVYMYDHGCTGKITDGIQTAYLLTDRLELTGWHPGDILSILPLTPQLTGLTITGLRYDLVETEVQMGTTRTISNEFTESGCGQLALASGLAVVLTQGDGSAVSFTGCDLDRK
ncbi:MAG TPA: thiamine diphosphokinase [Firmicutes bacterium]|jgi:thiamine pyrophosphokinase|nr:thiamine diphosphokinase [Bacillota bacterium]